TVSGTISLSGTGGTTNVSSHGINISGTGKINSDSGPIFLAGLARGTATSHGINLSAPNAITATSSLIQLSGTSNATGANSHGVSANTNGWISSTTGTISFTNCMAGGANACYGVAFSTSLTATGDVIFATITTQATSTG